MSVRYCAVEIACIIFILLILLISHIAFAVLICSINLSHSMSDKEVQAKAYEVEKHLR